MIGSRPEVLLLVDAQLLNLVQSKPDWHQRVGRTAGDISDFLIFTGARCSQAIRVKAHSAREMPA
jgi:hypothetical protein